MNAITPISRVPVSIRNATLADLPFMDALQRKHSKQVGWMPTATLEGKITLGHVLIAHDEQNISLGYCIGNDRYMKREDVGVIYQLNVSPGARRKLVGAALIKAMFERSAYGCRLFCCWCAQDIEANHFWEALGFIPLAFRAGSEKKSRVHIFWQRRIREGDTTTPWWFPSQTSSGSIREDRLVLPIPPGTRWSDAKPLVLPQDPATKALPGNTRRQPRKAPAPKQSPGLGAPLWFAPAAAEKPKEGKPKQPRTKRKNDPKLVAAARELRDRYLEQFNAGTLLPAGKYEVTRALHSRSATPMALSSSSSSSSSFDAVAEGNALARRN